MPRILDRLAAISAGCAVIVVLCIIALALLETAGAGKNLIAGAMVSVPLALYAAVGLMSSTSDPAGFAIAGGRIASASAGMAAAAQWTAAAFILGAPASLLLPGQLLPGHDGRPMLIGLTGGYVLSAVLISPFLRNSGARTLPAFLGARYGGLVRRLAVVVLIICSLAFLAGLIEAGASALGRTLAIDAAAARAVIVAMLILCALPGGMAGVTATQVAQYAILLAGAVAAFLIYADEPYGAPDLSAAASPRSTAFHLAHALPDTELTLCLMVGTASLPHILIHPMITRGMGEARLSSVWSLFFIALLAMVLPNYMALASTAENPGGTSVMPGLMSGLVAVIFLTGMLAAASALLFTSASSLVWRFRSPHYSCVALARALMLVVAALCAYAAQRQDFEPRAILEWAFSLAAGGFFPALVLGIWWPRTSAAGAACGIVAGFGLCLFYLAVCRYFPQAGINLFGMSPLFDAASGRDPIDAASVLADPRWLADVPASAANPLALKVGWLNIEPAACGILGLAAGFAMTVGVSLLGKPPSARQQAWIEALYAPGTKT